MERRDRVPRAMRSLRSIDGAPRGAPPRRAATAALPTRSVCRSTVLFMPTRQTTGTAPRSGRFSHTYACIRHRFRRLIERSIDRGGVRVNAGAVLRPSRLHGKPQQAAASSRSHSASGPCRDRPLSVLIGVGESFRLAISTVRGQIQERFRGQSRLPHHRRNRRVRSDTPARATGSPERVNRTALTLCDIQVLVRVAQAIPSHRAQE